MDFLFGIVVGLVLAILVIITLTFFRSRIEQNVRVFETQIANAGPRPKGFIVEPDSESEIARQQIVEENVRQGRETRLSDLQ